MKIQGWPIYGETADASLLAGILAHGIHAFTGPDAAINTALAADVTIVLLLTICWAV